MFGLLRARGVVAAITVLAALFATPSSAVAAQAVPASFQTIPSVTVELPPEITAASAPVPTLVPAPAPVRPLRDLVGAFVDYGDQDAEQLCLAKAVYFEARGESLEGQLAVAEVVLNRAASGRYPPTICSVVTQPAQFSFIRRGRFPSVDTGDSNWRRALAIADIARKELADQVPANVLWYHASYVSPSWGQRLTRVARIGVHIFYS